MISLIAVAGTLGVKGSLDEDRLYRVLAALHGIDLVSLHTQVRKEKQAMDDEQASYDMQRNAQLLHSLDLDLRETAIEKGLLDFASLQGKLQTAQQRFSGCRPVRLLSDRCR